MTQRMSLLKWKQECIAINFVVWWPYTLQKFDGICMIVDRLKNSAHFILLRTTYNADKLLRPTSQRLSICMTFQCPSFQIEALSLHHISRVLYNKLSTRIEKSITFLPQIGGQPERAIQVFEDILRAYVIDLDGHFDQL